MTPMRTASVATRPNGSGPDVMSTTRSISPSQYATSRRGGRGPRAAPSAPRAQSSNRSAIGQGAPGLDRRARGREPRPAAGCRVVVAQAVVVVMAPVWHARRSMGGHDHRPARAAATLTAPPPAGETAMTETDLAGAANQAGARIDTDAYAKAADFLPLKGIDHVEFWVGNARQAAAYYRALWGFTPVAFSGLETKVRDRASYVMVQNDIRFVFTAPLTPDGEIAEHVREHGDGVHDIAFAVDDVESAWRETTTRGAVSRPAARPSSTAARTASLRAVLDPHLRRGPPLVRRPARLPRRLRARLPQGQVARRRRPAGCRCSRSTTASATSGSARWTRSSTSTATCSASPS